MPDEPIVATPEEGGQPQPAPVAETIWTNDKLTKFKGSDGAVDYENVGKSYLQLEEMMSSRVSLPGADAKPEDLEKFYSKVRPSQASDYTIEAGGIDEFTDDIQAKWKQSFHKHGLTQAQVNGFMHDRVQDIISEKQAADAESLKLEAETQVALKSEWGANYEANKGLVKSMLLEMGGEEVSDFLGDALDYNAEAAKFFYETAKVMQTSSILKDEGKSNFGRMSVDEATAKKRDILTNPDNPMYQAFHSNDADERKRATKEINDLNQVIIQA